MDGVARMYVAQMLEKSGGATRGDAFGKIISIDQLLKIINHTITRVPKYTASGVDTFPLSSLFTEMMATEAVFHNESFNAAITVVLKFWCV